MHDRTVFFVSDGTGITAETFGNSILAQFSGKPRHVRRPFIDSVDKALGVVAEINEVAEREGRRPIVFITLVADEVRDVVTGGGTHRHSPLRTAQLSLASRRAKRHSPAQTFSGAAGSISGS